MSITIKPVEVDVEVLLYTFDNTTKPIAVSISGPLSIITMAKAIQSLGIKVIDYNRGEIIVPILYESLVDFSYDILIDDDFTGYIEDKNSDIHRFELVTNKAYTQTVEGTT